MHKKTSPQQVELPNFPGRFATVSWTESAGLNFIEISLPVEQGHPIVKRANKANLDAAVERMIGDIEADLTALAQRGSEPPPPVFSMALKFGGMATPPPIFILDDETETGAEASNVNPIEGTPSEKLRHTGKELAGVRGTQRKLYARPIENLAKALDADNTGDIRRAYSALIRVMEGNPPIEPIASLLKDVMPLVEPLLAREEGLKIPPEDPNGAALGKKI